MKPRTPSGATDATREGLSDRSILVRGLLVRRRAADDTPSNPPAPRSAGSVSGRDRLAAPAHRRTVGRTYAGGEAPGRSLRRWRHRGAAERPMSEAEQ